MVAPDRSSSVKKIVMYSFDGNEFPERKQGLSLSGGVK